MCFCIQFSISSLYTTAYAHVDIGGAAPTEAECINAFGTPASVGIDFRGVFKDDYTSGKCYLVHCDVTFYHTVQATAAV